MSALRKAAAGRIVTLTVLLGVVTASLLTSPGSTMVTGRAQPDGSVVDIKDGSAASRDALIAALQLDNTTVRLGPDVDMDLTGIGPIGIARGVVLTSVKSFTTSAPGKRGEVPRFDKQPPQARSASSVGPRLYTKSHPRPLFQIECFPGGAINDNVRISGFRLIGPDFGRADADAIGIQIRNCIGIDISNMEIAGWTSQAIRVVDDPRFDRPGGLACGGLIACTGRIDKPDQIKIHDNFIHNNQHLAKNGYGVDVGLGAYALIQRNVFDLNRHAIEANGDAGGYTAERNLVLKGGGYHGYGEYTHQFDVHGTENCAIKGLSGAAWNCGHAAGTMVYRENAFQYTSGVALRIRGTPRVTANIERNVFAHKRIEDSFLYPGAIHLNQGRENIEIGTGPQANIARVDPFAHYGVCDFDGDGKDDLFLATGVTWWYSSGGELQWSYLNAATEQLDQVRLGYFDDDLRCDVLAENTGNGAWEISSGGTAPWRTLGTFGVPLKEVVFGQFGTPQKSRAGGTRLTTHAFRRAPDGQWYLTELTAPNWQPAQSSSTPLDKLRFGDFTGDGVTDVLAVQAGRWAISDGARGQWVQVNEKLGSNLGPLQVADVDGDGRDDLVRFEAVSAASQIPSYSSGARAPWTPLKTLTGLTTPGQPNGTPVHISAFVGRFDDVLGADAMALGTTRIGRFANGVGGTWTSAYAY
jgi:hypothetical protein